MPLIIDSYRRAEPIPGCASRPAWLHVNDGTRSTGASVLVDHSGAEPFEQTLYSGDGTGDASYYTASGWALRVEIVRDEMSQIEAIEAPDGRRWGLIDGEEHQPLSGSVAMWQPSSPDRWELDGGKAALDAAILAALAPGPKTWADLEKSVATGEVLRAGLNRLIETRKVTYSGSGEKARYRAKAGAKPRRGRKRNG